MFAYRVDQAISHEVLLELYQSVGWSAYTEHVDDLAELLTGARHHISAWDNNQLIGLIRVVGDGVFIAYIQDILVHPDYQRQGIGRRLVEQILNEIAYARQIILTTDDSPKTKAFYQAVGFESFNESGLLGFTK